MPNLPLQGYKEIWSMPILLKYVHETYLNLIEDKGEKLLIYHTYQDVQKHLQESQDSDRDYWARYIAKIKEKTNLNTLISNKVKNGNIKQAYQYRIYEIQGDFRRALNSYNIAFSISHFFGMKRLVTCFNI